MTQKIHVKFSKANTLLLAAFLLGIFIGAMDTGIVAPARTVIETSLGIGADLSIWIITLYTLVYAVAMPISGRLSDLFGKKKIYLFSIAIFMTGSLLCGISNYFDSFGLLLLFRGIQAIGGGGIMPVATAYIGECFPVSKRGMALGLVGAIYGIATLLGPTLGSVILQFAGDNHWGYLFFVNVPICLTAILLVVCVKSKETAAQKVKIDFLGSILLAVVVASLMYAVTNINFTEFSKTIRDFNVWFFLLVFVVFLPLLIVCEKKNKEPILRLQYFSDRDMALTLAIAFFVGCGMMGLVFIPQFAENMLKLKPGAGGYVVTLVAIFAGLGGPIGGKIIDRFSSRLLLMIGFLTTITASLLIARVVVPQNNAIVMHVSFALLGLGMGFTMGTPLNYLIQLFSPPGQSGSGQSTLSLLRSVGVALSPNLLIGFIASAGQKVPHALIKIVPAQRHDGTSLFAQNATSTAAQVFADANVTNIVQILRNYADEMIAKSTAAIPLPAGTEVATMIKAMQFDYNQKLNTAAPQIEAVFQKTLNEGFANVFLTIGGFALAGLILTFFLTGKEKELKRLEIEKETQNAADKKLE